MLRRSGRVLVLTFVLVLDPVVKKPVGNDALLLAGHLLAF